MSWNLTVSCDGCGDTLEDVTPRWWRGHDPLPTHVFHPFVGSLPDGWVWHTDDDGDDVSYCPSCADYYDA